MAAMESNLPQGKTKRLKASINIDFTPMVDLGFLLITFFMLTTTLMKHQIIEVENPEKHNQPQPVKESQVLTLIVNSDSGIFYYDGVTNPILHSITLNDEKFEKLIYRKAVKLNPLIDSIPYLRLQYNLVANDTTAAKTILHRIEKIKANHNGLMCLIKMQDSCKLKNMINIIDVLSNCHVGRYSFVELEERDKQLMAQAKFD